MYPTLLSVKEVLRDIEAATDIIEPPYQVSLLLSSPCTKILRTMFGSSVADKLYRFSIIYYFIFISFLLSYF